ncbi:MAG TPA: methylmalonyl Co-A mutase-associated GTPase MeaB [Acidimicrobiia bacterium]|nr:methylmalonyl Co-A mutase-associated GTPase MeaB [Acidimicrobiia bacterium]
MESSQLAERVLAGDRRALARAISVVEDSEDTELLSLLHPHGGGARIVGITGAPGSGKSTLTDRLIAEARTAEHSVAVLAVDPSSPFTGGAVLGDRIRMQDHVADPGVYIRSMSTRGALGGVSNATEAATVVLDAAGFDVVFVETVGVGQSEVDVMRLVETTVVVVAPGFGDGVQAAKAGVLEIGDVFVVNKSDLPGADSVVRDLTQMLELGMGGSWDPPIVSTSALEERGIDRLWMALESHREHLAGPDGATDRRARVELSIRRSLLSRLGRQVAEREIPTALVDDVLARRSDPWRAAAELLQLD